MNKGAITIHKMIVTMFLLRFNIKEIKFLKFQTQINTIILRQIFRCCFYVLFQYN